MPRNNLDEQFIYKHWFSNLWQFLKHVCPYKNSIAREPIK